MSPKILAQDVLNGNKKYASQIGGKKKFPKINFFFFGRQTDDNPLRADLLGVYL